MNFSEMDYAKIRGSAVRVRKPAENPDAEEFAMSLKPNARLILDAVINRNNRKKPRFVHFQP